MDVIVPGSPTRLCGAAIKANDLILVTVVREAERFAIDAKASSRLTLSDDTDQAAVRAFFALLQAFVRDNGIDRIAIRGRQTKGRFAGGSTSFKIEGLIQLLDGCTVTIMTPQTIAARIKRHPVEMPASARVYQRDAFEVACVAMAGADY